MREWTVGYLWGVASVLLGMAVGFLAGKLHGFIADAAEPPSEVPEDLESMK